MIRCATKVSDVATVPQILRAVTVHQSREASNHSGLPLHHQSTAPQPLYKAIQPLYATSPLFNGYRYASTGQETFKKVIKKMGFFRYSKTKLKRSGFELYSNMNEKIFIQDFFQVCNLPDTFYSWFLVTELHIWMLSVRLMAEGNEGKFTRNSLIEALWEDSDTRSKKLGAASLSIRKEQMESISSSFQAALFSYDEALVADDRVLAGALWRRLFSQNCDDPERLECCVQYVRKQIAMLDRLPREEFMLDCKVNWTPLLERD